MWHFPDELRADRVDDDLSAKVNTHRFAQGSIFTRIPSSMASSPSSRTDGLTPVGGKQSSFITQNHDQTAESLVNQGDRGLDDSARFVFGRSCGADAEADR